MPLTSCPECHSAMKVVPRGEVLIDVCPSCRGVWLDGGELEKILVDTRENEAERLANEARSQGRSASPREAEFSQGKKYDKKSEKKKKKKKRFGFDLDDLLGDLFD